MIDIIFIAIVIVSAAVFIYFTRKTNSNPKTKKKKGKTKKPQKKQETEIPEAWRKDNPGSSHKSSSFSFHKPAVSKIHVPGLRLAKRVLAVLLLGINFFIAQATLTSAPASQPLYLLFLLNAFILLDYLWKTKRS